MLQLPITYIGAAHRARRGDEGSAQLASACEDMASNRPDLAQEKASDARAIFQKRGDLQSISDATRVLMVALADYESRAEALDIGEAHLAELRKTGQRAEEALVLQSLAEVAAFRCRGERRMQAVAWAEEAIGIQKELEDKVFEGYAHLALASALIQKGVKAHQRKHYQKAVKALKAALALFGAVPVPQEDEDTTSFVLARSGEARALHGLASACGRLEDFRTSVNRAREAAAIWQELGFRLEEALELEFLARLQLQLGQFKEGRKSGEEALKIFIGLKISIWQGVTLRTLVKALLRGKKIKEARKLVTRRQALFEEAKDVVGKAAALDATAEVLMAEGQAIEAANLLKEAMKLAKNTQMKDRQLKKYEATMTAEQANFYLQGQKYEEALQTAKSAFHLFEKLQCQVEMATTLSTMVMAHLCLEHPDKALEDTKKAINIYESLNDKKGEGLAWINHCSGLTKMGDFDEAMKVANKARDIFASQKLLIGEGQSLDHLSSLHMTRGDFAKSATCAKRARQIFNEAACFRQEAFMAWAEAEAVFGLAQTQAEDFKPDEELPEVCRKAAEAAEEALRLAKEADDELLTMHAMQVVAKTRIMCFRHWEAGPFVEESLEIAQKNNQRMEEASLWLLKAQICICDGEDDKAKENAIKSRDMFEEMGNEQGMEQAREIIDGDYLRQQREQEEMGITAATPMPMMPSESQMYGAGGIGGRTGGPGPGPSPMAPPPAAASAPAAPVAPPKGGPTLQQIEETVQDIAMSLIGSDELQLDSALMDAGLDSLASVEFQNTLTKEFRGVAMPSTLMFDFPTAKEIAQHIKDNFRG